MIFFFSFFLSYFYQSLDSGTHIIRPPFFIFCKLLYIVQLRYKYSLCNDKLFVLGIQYLVVTYSQQWEWHCTLEYFFQAKKKGTASEKKKQKENDYLQRMEKVKKNSFIHIKFLSIVPFLNLSL